jgi:hypothetical protein
MTLLFPLLRFLIQKSFRISTRHHEKAVEHIDALLGDVEVRLEKGATSILGGDQINYTDISFAAIMGLWLQPDGYGGGMADSVRVEREMAPKGMQDEIQRWEEKFPLCTEFIKELYRTERR